MTYAIDTSHARDLGNKASDLLLYAEMLVVTDHESHQAAANDLKAIKQLYKDIEERRTAITAPMNAALKAANDLFRGPKETLSRAEQLLKRAIGTYQAKLEAEAARARAAAEAAAEEERQRLRIEAEKLRAEITPSADAEANIIEAAVELITAPQIKREKVQGAGNRASYRADVTDGMALLKAVIEGTAPLEAIEINTRFLDTQARAMKRPTGAQLYPGVLSVKETKVVAR